MAPVSDGIAFFRSGVNTSAEVVYQPLGGGSFVAATVVSRPSKSKAGASPYAPYDGTGFVTPELVTFPSEDGEFTIHSQLFLPPQELRRSTRGVPGVIFTHGGSERQMYAAMHYCK